MTNVERRSKLAHDGVSGWKKIIRANLPAPQLEAAHLKASLAVVLVSGVKTKAWLVQQASDPQVGWAMAPVAPPARTALAAVYIPVAAIRNSSQ